MELSYKKQNCTQINEDYIGKETNPINQQEIYSLAKQYSKDIIGNFKDEGGFDSANKGFNFGSSGKGNAKLSNSASTCWYPAAGTRLESDGSMQAVGISGFYWASSIYYGAGLCLHVGKTDYIRFGTASYCASALAVRCLKE